jgi:hypothetical protein
MVGREREAKGEANAKQCGCDASLAFAFVGDAWLLLDCVCDGADRWRKKQGKDGIHLS